MALRGGFGKHQLQWHCFWGGPKLNFLQTLPVDMKYDTSLADAAYALAARWDAARKSDKLDFSAEDIKSFNAMQIGKSSLL